ncbi:hypothetical protein A2311_05015 [candidate division WOR-1 bacterium RIFOXYB2_FULL_48_7]|uniref:DNA binding HTH domain-containing protein n=1 Tax=candidate division WOR-1 bacterium RIFOXYB2_FULL_48_7 TaxID=1802583 RepID=A0A1F4TKP8_UNCSA|nr:MAG: hypothetical protein A2311_05015 [candidate division WOR-1 bacterium RIFOXYB2_FULL_48_7]
MFIEDKINQLAESFFSEHEGNVYRFLVESLERPLLERVLISTKGNQLEASRILGINRNTLRDKLRKLGIKKQ